jgi:hypothetical protein
LRPVQGCPEGDTGPPQDDRIIGIRAEEHDNAWCGPRKDAFVALPARVMIAAGG